MKRWPKVTKVDPKNTKKKTNLLSKLFFLDFPWAVNTISLKIHYFWNSTIYCSTPYSTELHVKNWVEKKLLYGICNMYLKQNFFCWLLWQEIKFPLKFIEFRIQPCIAVHRTLQYSKWKVDLKLFCYIGCLVIFIWKSLIACDPLWGRGQSGHFFIEISWLRIWISQFLKWHLTIL